MLAYAFNHVKDLQLGGGRPLDAVLLGVVSVLGLIAVILRIRQLRAAGATEEGAR
ncbi:hypothetical protein [Plantactinospora mayteni]|uniref:hypothetical protein n=1 Tax=Plantactinospora mayteni TaxID=566021 RepID=UPI001941D65F|nr:hypothetical protein [Plantactinospora mayteni]